MQGQPLHHRPGCAYNYGWHAAANAMATGKKQLGRGVLGHTWWLDVETTNTWNGDGPANTAVLQGMLDYLRSHGVAKVGLYSTAFQWKTITGGYTAATAARYRAAWDGYLIADFPLHEAPLWIATAAGSGTARSEVRHQLHRRPDGHGPVHQGRFRHQPDLLTCRSRPLRGALRAGPGGARGRPATRPAGFPVCPDPRSPRSVPARYGGAPGCCRSACSPSPSWCWRCRRT